MNCNESIALFLQQLDYTQSPAFERAVDNLAPRTDSLNSTISARYAEEHGFDLQRLMVQIEQSSVGEAVPQSKQAVRDTFAIGAALHFIEDAYALWKTNRELLDPSELCFVCRLYCRSRVVFASNGDTQLAVTVVLPSGESVQFLIGEETKAVRQESSTVRLFDSFSAAVQYVGTQCVGRFPVAFMLPIINNLADLESELSCVDSDTSIFPEPTRFVLRMCTEEQEPDLSEARGLVYFVKGNYLPSRDKILEYLRLEFSNMRQVSFVRPPLYYALSGESSFSRVDAARIKDAGFNLLTINRMGRRTLSSDIVSGANGKTASYICSLVGFANHMLRNGDVIDDTCYERIVNDFNTICARYDLGVKASVINHSILFCDIGVLSECASHMENFYIPDVWTDRQDRDLFLDQFRDVIKEYLPLIVE